MTEESHRRRSSILERADQVRRAPYRVRFAIVENLASENVAAAQWAPDRSVTEADLFAAAYGDPTGAVHWQTFLDAPRHPDHIASTLAMHTATAPEWLDDHRKAARAALNEAMAPGLPHSIAVSNVSADRDPRGQRIDTRQAVQWLAARRQFADAIPASLRRFLDSEPATSAPGPKPGAPTAKELACDFAIEFLENGVFGPPKRGRLMMIVRAVHAKLQDQAISYQVDSIRTMIKDTVREWETKNPDR